MKQKCLPGTLFQIYFVFYNFAIEINRQLFNFNRLIDCQLRKENETLGINTNYLLKTNTDGEKTLNTKADFKFPIFRHLTVDMIGKKTDVLAWEMARILNVAIFGCKHQKLVDTGLCTRLIKKSQGANKPMRIVDTPPGVSIKCKFFLCNQRVEQQQNLWKQQAISIPLGKIRTQP